MTSLNLLAVEKVGMSQTFNNSNASFGVHDNATHFNLILNFTLFIFFISFPYFKRHNSAVHLGESPRR